MAITLDEGGGKALVAWPLVVKELFCVFPNQAWNKRTMLWTDLDIFLKLWGNGAGVVVNFQLKTIYYVFFSLLYFLLDDFAVEVSLNVKFKS